MPDVVQPPMASTMSEGHSTKRSLSRSECLNEWTTQPFGVRGFNHLLIAALAELEFTSLSPIYLGKAYFSLTCFSLLAAQYELPINGICLWLPEVFKERQG